jgi:hypothetical protein
MANPFEAYSSRSPRAETEQEPRLKLGVLWEKKRITNEKLHERGVKHAAEDLAKYNQIIQQFGMMKKTEQPGWAEWMFMEGADTEGLTGKRYAWFGDRAQIYPANKVDDVLRRTDAIMMIADKDDERIGYPLAIDITTDPSAVPDKAFKDFSRLIGAEPAMSEANWVDVNAEDPELYYDEPHEGKIKTVNASVYIPEDLAAKFRDKDFPEKDADRLMRKLGPFVLYQLIAELEAEALLLIGDAKLDDLRRGAIASTISTRSGLLKAIELNKKTNPKKTAALLIVQNALEALWDAQKEQPQFDPELVKLLPKHSLALGVLAAQDEVTAAE